MKNLRLSIRILPFLFLPLIILADKIDKQFFYYTIKSGNTLSFVTQYFGVSKEVLAQNNSKRILDNFYKDEVLKIPLNRSVLIAYTIQKGDTLFSIEKRMGLNPNTLTQILDENTKKNFWPGKTIYIPNHSKTIYKVPSNPSTTSPSKKTQASTSPTKAVKAPAFYTYQVQKGDSFFSISQKLSIPLATLQKIYAKNTLQYDTNIKIPSNLIKTTEALRILEAQPQISPPALLPNKTVSQVKVPEPVITSLKQVGNETILSPLKNQKSKDFSSLAPGKVFDGVSSVQALLAPLSGIVTDFKPFFSFGRAIFYQTKKGTFVLASKGFTALNVKKNQVITRGLKLTFINPSYSTYVFLINDQGDLQNPW